MNPQKYFMSVLVATLGLTAVFTTAANAQIAEETTTIEMPEMPEPQEEHKWLERFEGEWWPTGDIVRVTSRRGSMTLPAKVVATIRPDTVFVPYHWAGRKSANQLTIAAQDPISKIPEYKVCAVRMRRADGPPDYAKELEPQQ